MVAISLKLPNDLARESKEIAQQLGISRTELIRQALRHELARVQAQIERKAISRALQAMREDPSYLQESAELDDRLGDTLPDEPDRWWQGT